MGVAKLLASVSLQDKLAITTSLKIENKPEDIRKVPSIVPNIVSTSHIRLEQ